MSNVAFAMPAEIRLLPIASVRKDGETQHRSSIDPAIVAEYSDLMRSGGEFPPVRVWWDGKYFWLSDGFQRIAAAESAALKEIPAQVFSGTLSDAKWDSYAVNAIHGVRRSVEDTKRILKLAMEHPNAAHLSNVELAKHLHLPEATLRRWRKALSSSRDEDEIRIVRRGSSTYTLATRRLGKTVPMRRTKLHGQLRVGLESMKEQASPKTRRILNIIGNWAFGCATDTECLEAIERLVRSRSS